MSGFDATGNWYPPKAWRVKLKGMAGKGLLVFADTREQARAQVQQSVCLSYPAVLARLREEYGPEHGTVESVEEMVREPAEIKLMGTDGPNCPAVEATP